ncbi:hypothetical protein BDQ17DRAFT_1436495 [Cyathus striatus]|nr:hypothetical protein BDQ17DRAFT_1436495 [Cyathus striatus]
MLISVSGSDGDSGRGGSPSSAVSYNSVFLGWFFFRYSTSSDARRSSGIWVGFRCVGVGSSEKKCSGVVICGFGTIGLFDSNGFDVRVSAIRLPVGLLELGIDANGFKLPPSVCDVVRPSLGDFGFLSSSSSELSGALNFPGVVVVLSRCVGVLY